MSINQFIEKINNNENLSFEESKNTFLEIMSGKISEDLIFPEDSIEIELEEITNNIPVFLSLLIIISK